MCQTAKAAPEPVRKALLDQVVDLPNKNFNVKVRTISWPVGYKTAPHTHGGPGPRYVLKGSVEIDDAGTIKRYGAGDTFWHAGGIAHTAENLGSNEATVLIIELLPKK